MGPMVGIPPPSGVLLSVWNLSLRFGGIVALNDISFDVPERIVCGLIGPNGAGKSTLFNCISRLQRFDDGTISLAGRPLSHLRPSAIAGLGIGRTFQNLALFPSLTVLDNILLGAHSHSRGGFLANALKLPLARREESRLQRAAHALAEFVGLASIVGRIVADLPLGLRKRVELARALAGQPRLLLLDEPAAGLIQEEVTTLGRLIRDLCDRLGVTVLLVEHHINLVMSVCDKVVVLDFGRKIAEGTPAEIRVHPEVVRAYLGRPA